MATITEKPVWTPLLQEINGISREDLRNFVKFGLSAAPAYFWTVAASTSGKYHPPECRKTGGLVHHTRMVVYFVKALMVSMECEIWRDELIAAAILHDAYKNGDDPNDRRGMAYWSAHGVHLRGLLERQADWTKWQGPDTFSSVNKVLDMCARHMHRWGPKEWQPATREDWCLAIADYVASRKLVNIVELDENKAP